jgi:hypothetical protein
LLRVPCGSHWEAVAAAAKPVPPTPPKPTKFPAAVNVSPNGLFKVTVGDHGAIQIHHINGEIRYL